VLVGTVIALPEPALGAILGFFAGFFLYVGAAELLPEAHRRDRSRWIALATIGGAVAIYAFSFAVGAIGIEAP
jgi:ZIP family zinc transporter